MRVEPAIGLGDQPLVEPLLPDTRLVAGHQQDGPPPRVERELSTAPAARTSTNAEPKAHLEARHPTRPGTQRLGSIYNPESKCYHHCHANARPFSHRRPAARLVDFGDAMEQKI